MRNDDLSSPMYLVLMSAPENLSECATVPPLANSDHLGISVKLKNQTYTSQEKNNLEIETC